MTKTYCIAIQEISGASLAIVWLAPHSSARNLPRDRGSEHLAEILKLMLSNESSSINNSPQRLRNDLEVPTSHF
jgi:hypothetical protein